MSVIYSDRHQRYIDTDFESEEDYDTEEDLVDYPNEIEEKDIEEYHNKKETQKQMVIDQLETTGMVSRNWALSNYISRLGAIMCDLKDRYDYEGMNKGNDYIYVIVA